MNIRDKIIRETKSRLTAPGSDETRGLFANLLLAGKNLSLYPKGHSICVNSIEQFHARLDAFIRRWGDVKIEVERERVIFGGDIVHTGSLEEGTLPFTLFRDGIRWLEFTSGVGLDEVRELLSILNRYAVLSAEPEGDIVTALWEAQFAHVQYEAANFFSGLDGDRPDGTIESGARHSAAEDEVHGKTPYQNEPAIDPACLTLTPQELADLEEMIHCEETADASSRLNMLLDSLLQYQDEDDFGVILDVLSDEFTDSLVRHDFEASLIILDGLQYVLDSGRIRAPWAGRLTESFYHKISDAAHLKPLEDVWSNMHMSRAAVLGSVFQRLQPRAVSTLARLLLIHKPEQLEQMLEDAVISLVRQDANCLDPIVNDTDERAAARLAPVLYKLGGEVSKKYLMKLARHASPSVRLAAVKSMARGHEIEAADIFRFIDDPDEAVRRAVLKHMGRSRDEVVEDVLLHYLQNSHFNSSQDEHVLSCFRALGQCGSERSVPFLRKTLLSRKWMADLKKSAYRRGALIALAGLKTPEARKVIEDASRSMHPGLRRMAREAGRIFSPENKGGQ